MFFVLAPANQDVVSRKIEIEVLFICKEKNTAKTAVWMRVQHTH